MAKYRQEKMKKRKSFQAKDRKMIQLEQTKTQTKLLGRNLST